MVDTILQLDDLLSMRDFKKAEVVIAKLLRSANTNGERARLLVYRAKARLLSMRLDQALDDLSVARTTAPELFNQPEVQELLADCYLARFEIAALGFADKADLERAREIYESILKEWTDYNNAGWINYQLARVSLALGQADKANVLLRDALFLPSTRSGLTAFCFERLAFVAFYERRDPASARLYIDKAIDTYPTLQSRAWLAQAHILQTRVLQQLDPYAALNSAKLAIENFEYEASTDKSQTAEAYFSLAEVLSRLENHDYELISVLQQFFQLSKSPPGMDVTWSRAYEMLGDAYARLQQHQHAVVAYQASLQYNPHHPWEESIYYRIARSYYAQGAYRETIQTIEQVISAITRDDEIPNDYRLFNILGNAYFALKEYQSALYAYERALSLDAPNTEVERIRQYQMIASQHLNNPS